MDNTELARFYDDDKNIHIFTVSDYHNLIDSKDKNGISYFIFNRLYSRYIKPYCFNNPEYKEYFKNGFSIMANLCLLVEALQSFKHGWGDSAGKSGEAFNGFFNNNKHFKEFNQKGSEIYKNIRCGILHQGETTGGWKITRKGSELYDSKTNTIDAVLFTQKMINALSDYRDDLVNSEWDSEIWNNFRLKMKSVVLNCISL